MTTQKRDNEGKYRKRSGWKWVIRIMVMFLLIYLAGEYYEEYRSKHLEPIVEITQVSDELTPEERASLKKQYELSEREIVLNKQKAKLDADYKAQSDAVESKLEAVRKEKLTFTQAPKL